MNQHPACATHSRPACPTDRGYFVFHCLRLPQWFGLLLMVGLSGCASFLGSGNERERPTLYAPDPLIHPDPDWPQADISLLIAPPSASPLLDSVRILVRVDTDEVQVLRGARWAQPPPDMLQTLILRTLEDSARIQAVARQGTGIAADVTLAIELRRFEVDYGHGAVARVDIAFTAKLIHRRDQRVIASSTFQHSHPVQETSPEVIVTAFTSSLGQLTTQLAGWILTAVTDGQDAR